MTEAEWLAATEPGPMLEHLKRKVSNRKLRLFGCTCARRLLALSRNASLLELVNAGERVAYGEDIATEAGVLVAALLGTDRDDWSAADHAIMAGAIFAAGHPPNDPRFRLAFVWLARAAGWRAAPNAVTDIELNAPHDPVWRSALVAEYASQALLFRDILGNPFRRITLSPSWRTPTVTAIARQMYDTRDFSPMPILADALQDARCENTDVLDHCRGGGVHVRGCWVVDLVLAKS